MNLKDIAIAVGFSSMLAGCGGSGGGPGSDGTVEIGPPRLIPSTNSIGTVDIPLDNNGFIAAIRNVSADGKADALEAVQVFRWIDNHSNYDREYMRNYEVDIEGTTYNLYDAYDLLLGYKKAFYDGKEGLWLDIINRGSYDDTDARFTEIQLLGLNVTDSQLLAIGKGEKTVDEVKTEIEGELPTPVPVDPPEDDAPDDESPDVELPQDTPGTPTPGAVKDAQEYRTQEFYATPTSTNDNLLDTIKADVAWSRGWTGSGAKIVIADTGARVSHNDLDANIVNTWNFISGNTNVTDTIGHGTHIAGIIGAELNGTGMIGVAPDAELMIAKVSYGDGSVRFDYAKQAVEWGKNAGAIAANLSIALNADHYYHVTLVEDGEGNWYSTSDYYGKFGYAGAKAVAPDWADALGTNMVLVKAAGNDGLAYSAGINQMATATDENGNLILDGQMLVVGNWDTDNQRLHTSSNAAGNVCTTYVDNACQDAAKIKDFYILAPGTGIYSASSSSDTDYKHMSGTSMSAAAVTGAVAIVHQLWPHMKGKNLVQLLLVTANKDITQYDENVHGQGLLDLDAATQPVGIVGIPLSGSTSGTVTKVTGGISGTVPLGKVASSTMVLDSFQRDFYLDLSQANTVMDTRKTSFVENETNGDVTSSFASFAGDVYQFGNVTLAGYNQDNFAVAKQFNNWEFGFVNEKNTMLGNEFSGVFALGDTSQTVYGARNLSHSALGIEFTGRAELGYTVNNADNPGSMVKNVNDVVSVAVHAGAFKQLGDFKIGATASIPTRIVSGEIELDVPVARTLKGAVVTETQTVDLSKGRTEANLGLSLAYTAGRHNVGAYVEQRVNYAGTNDNVAEYGLHYKLDFDTDDVINASTGILRLVK